MFFQKQAIEKHLKCQSCHNIYSDPRMLPCSHSFCKLCLKPSKDGRVECVKCKTSHPVPHSGFPVNGVIIDMLQEQASEVSQSNKVKELREKMKEIQNKKRGLVKSLNAGSDEIQEYCMSLKTKIDLETEKRIEEIRKFNTQLKTEIESYERECLTSCSSILETINQDVCSFLQEIDCFHSEVDLILNEPELEDRQVELLINKCNQKMSSIDAKKRLLETKKFNGKLMMFEPPQSTWNSTCLGVIRINSSIPANVATSCSSFVEQKVINAWGDYPNSQQKCVGVTFCESIQLFYVAFQNGPLVQLAFFNKQGLKTEKKFKISADPAYDCSFRTFLTSSRDKCILVVAVAKTRFFNFCANYICIQDKFFHLQEQSTTIFCEINNNQDYVKHTTLNSVSCSLFASNESNIFCLDTDLKKLNVYTRDLSKTVAVMDSIIPRDVTAMEANQSDLFILHGRTPSKLLVIDIKRQTIKREIETDFDQLKLNSLGQLVVFNNTNNILAVYSQTDVTKELARVQLDVKQDKKYTLSRDQSRSVILFNQQWEIVLFDQNLSQ